MAYLGASNGNGNHPAGRAPMALLVADYNAKTSAELRRAAMRAEEVANLAGDSRAPRAAQCGVEPLRLLSAGLTDLSSRNPFGLCAAYRSCHVIEDFYSCPSFATTQALMDLGGEVDFVAIWNDSGDGLQLSMQAVVPVLTFMHLSILGMHIKRLQKGGNKGGPSELSRAQAVQRKLRAFAELNSHSMAAMVCNFICWVVGSEKVACNVTALHRFNNQVSDAQEYEPSQLVDLIVDVKYLPSVVSAVAQAIRGPMKVLLLGAGSLLLHTQHLDPSFREIVVSIFDFMDDFWSTIRASKKLGTVNMELGIKAKLFDRYEVVTIDSLEHQLSCFAEGFAPIVPALGLSNRAASSALRDEAKAQVAAAEQQRLQAAASSTFKQAANMQRRDEHMQWMMQGMQTLLAREGNIAMPGASPMRTDAAPQLGFR